jgi:hypothetical protein
MSGVSPIFSVLNIVVPLEISAVARIRGNAAFAGILQLSS